MDWKRIRIEPTEILSPSPSFQTPLKLISEEEDIRNRIKRRWSTIGTHGSLTKSGKVRSLTPKIDPMPHPPTHPRKRVRANYKKRIILGRRPGQYRR